MLAQTSRTLTIGITFVGSGIGQAALDSLRQSDLPLRIVGFDASPWAKGAYECDTGQSGCAFYECELSSSVGVSRFEETFARVIAQGVDLS